LANGSAPVSDPAERAGRGENGRQERDLFHLIAAEYSVFDLLPGFLLSPDVLVVVLEAQPEVDLHDLGWCGLRLLGARGHDAISCASMFAYPTFSEL